MTELRCERCGSNCIMNGQEYNRIRLVRASDRGNVKEDAINLCPECMEQLITWLEPPRKGK